MPLISCESESLQNNQDSNSLLTKPCILLLSPWNTEAQNKSAWLVLLQVARSHSVWPWILPGPGAVLFQRRWAKQTDLTGTGRQGQRDLEETSYQVGESLHLQPSHWQLVCEQPILTPHEGKARGELVWESTAAWNSPERSQINGKETFATTFVALPQFLQLLRLP